MNLEVQKVCRVCRQSKPLHTEFYADTTRRDGYDSKCKTCAKAGARRAYRASKISVRERKLMEKYGMTLVLYEALLAEQNGVCAICSGDYPLLNVDHDHATGRIRGLLCRSCNHGLGNFKDSTNFLMKAILYLEADSEN